MKIPTMSIKNLILSEDDLNKVRRELAEKLAEGKVDFAADTTAHYLTGFMDGASYINEGLKRVAHIIIKLDVKELVMSEEALEHMTNEEAEALNKIAKAVAERARAAEAEIDEV